MRLFTLVAFLTLFVFGVNQTVFAQEKGIQIEHHKGKRVKFLKENRRIKVFTEDGNKYKGRYTIVDNETIEINGSLIKIEDIEVIRKKDLIVSIVKGAVFGFGTILFVGGITSTGGIGAAIVATFGAFLNVLAVTIPEIAIGELDNDRWSYRIIN